MLLGGEAPVDSYNCPSNGNVPAAENENSSNNLNGSNVEPNLIQAAPPSQAQQQITDDYNKISPKDNNQNFLPESNLDLYQQQHQTQSQTHISPRVQPYDLNVAHQQAHHHHLRSGHMTQYNNNNNANNGRKIPSPYKNLNHQNSINNNSSIIYDGIVSSSSGNEMNDMMVLKEEPENGY